MAIPELQLDHVALRERLQLIFERWDVKRAVLFGSLARGEATLRSDVDLLIVQETEKRWLDRYEGILREITAAIPGHGVDLLIYTPQELKIMAKRPFIGKVLKEGLVIYESD